MEIKEIIDSAIANNEVAGMNILVKKNGQEIFYYEAGYANIEKKTPYKRDAIVRMYSMSKPITGAAVMLLLERGQLALSQYVDTILPGFKNQLISENGKEVICNRRLTINHLLGMVSGLPYGGNLASISSMEVEKIFVEIDEKMETEDELTTVEIANRLGQCPADFHPGEGWEYGTSADVLGAVVEVVSGMKFSEFLQKEFFEPLEMKDTGFFVPADKQDRLADVYMRTEDGLVFEPTRRLGFTYNRLNEPRFESGGAGIVSTIDDYDKFAQMLLNDGMYKDKQILKKSTVEFFTKPAMTRTQQDEFHRVWPKLTGYSYGNLMRRCVDRDMAPVKTWNNEYGWDGWLGTFFGNCKDNETTILMTLQVFNAGDYPLVEKLRGAVYEMIED